MFYTLTQTENDIPANGFWQVSPRITMPDGNVLIKLDNNEPAWGIKMYKSFPI